jgi:glycosyltransferase involved in cell wall biosynthesis
MKILILTQIVDSTDPALGFFHRWIAEFAKNFEAVTVIALRKGESSLPKNVTVLSLGKEEGASRFEYVRRFYSYIWKRRGSYDAVFVHMNPEYVVLGGLLWKMLGKKIVLWYMHRTVDLKLRLATLLADSVATGSRESFRLKSGKVNVLGHGIDVDRFEPKQKRGVDGFSVVTIGRISPSKDYETFLKAIALVPEAKAMIIGAPANPEDGEYEKRLKNLADELGLHDRVRFMGPAKHDDVPRLISCADIFVNMSNTGSLDKAVLEAMAGGVPSLTSNEAFKDMLEPFGLTFPEKDSQALAKKIRGLMARRTELNSLGEKLRDIVVKQHSLPRLITEIQALYETSR